MLFPLRHRPRHSYRESPRCFGAQRRDGRLHAGCDLYAPAGTEILAMADGVVLRDPYEFFRGTQALEVDHGDYIIRYSEMSHAAPGLRAGSAVSRGQVLGYVGQLQGLPLHPMLHLEIYDKSRNEGPLTRKDLLPYMRRADVLDPADLLDAAEPSVARVRPDR